MPYEVEVPDQEGPKRTSREIVEKDNQTSELNRRMPWIILDEGS